MRKVLAGLGIVVVLAGGLAACSSQGDEDSSSGATTADARGGDGGGSAESSTPDMDVAAGDDSGGGGVDPASPEGGRATVPVDVESGQLPGVERDIIYTADLAVSSRDVQDASDEATRIVGRAGGYVFQQTADLDRDEPTVDITFKVPPDRFDEVVTQLSGLGELENRDVSTDDVTGTVVDLEARLATARASADRLRALLSETGSVVDLVAVEQALAQREAEVESLEGQLRSLEAQVDLATVALHLATSEDAPPADDGDADDEDTGFAAGFGTAVDGLVAAAEVGAAVVGFTLPLLPFVAIAFGVAVVVRRRRGTPDPADAAPS